MNLDRRTLEVVLDKLRENAREWAAGAVGGRAAGNAVQIVEELLKQCASPS